MPCAVSERAPIATKALPSHTSTMDLVNPVLDRHDIRAEDKDSAAEAMAEQDLDRAASNYGDARYGEAREILERDRAFGEGAAAPGLAAPAGWGGEPRPRLRRARRCQRTGDRHAVQLRGHPPAARGDGDGQKELRRGGRLRQAGLAGRQASRRGSQPRGATDDHNSDRGGGPRRGGRRGQPRRRVRSRWSREARGHALRGERLQARKQAAGERRRSQRGYRVSRGRDRRSVFRGF